MLLGLFNLIYTAFHCIATFPPGTASRILWGPIRNWKCAAAAAFRRLLKTSLFAQYI